MGRFRVLKNSLLGGQISRDALGRTDLPNYNHACELLQNMIPLLSGGAYRRPGTVFTDYIPANTATPDYIDGNPHLYQSSPPRLFPFVVSSNLAYVVAIATQRWAVSQAVVNPNTVGGGAFVQAYRVVGNENAAVSPSGSNIYGEGVLPYRCKSFNVATTATDQAVYTRQGGPGAVANSGVNAAAAAILDVADSLQTFDDDIWSVQYCQANDVMFLTHPDYPPQTVWLNASDDMRAAPYDWLLTGLALGQSRPYLNQNSTAVTLALSGTTLTASAPLFDPLHARRTGCEPEASGIAGGARHDGALFAIAVAEGSNMATGYPANSDHGIIFVEVVSVTSSTVATVSVISDARWTGVPSAYAGVPTTVWWESAWSNFRGWPKACAIFQQRLCFAGTQHQPNAVWMTGIGTFGAPISAIASSVACKFTALGDGPNQGFVSGTKGTLANGQTYSTPANWVYYPVDDSQGDGQSTGPIGSQPFRISLATTSQDAIQYLSPDQQLFIGTAAQEWVVALANGSFDVANHVCTIQSHYGSDLVQAIRIGYELIFVHQNKAEIRAYQYNYFDQSFFGEPVQLFFDEYPTDEGSDGIPAVLGVTQVNGFAGRKKYRQIDWDASRSTLWCVDTAGSLFGITRDRKLQITAWHTHQLGGFNSEHGPGQNITDNLTVPNYYTDAANFLCDGSVISVCSVPNPLSGTRDLWMVVKRSYQGGSNTIYSIERMIGANTVRHSAYSVVAPGNAQEPCYVDSAVFLTDNGVPSNVDYTVLQNPGGSSHLKGVTLEGTYYSEAWGMFVLGTQAAVAANGAIKLVPDQLPPDYGDTSKPHTMVLGMHYDSIIQPVRIDPPSPIGTSQGAIKRISKAYVRLFKTLMLKVGSPPINGNPAKVEVVRFQPSNQMAQSPEIYTGDKEVFVPATFDRTGYLYLLQDQPLPFTLVSLSIEGQEYEQ